MGSMICLCILLLGHLANMSGATFLTPEQPSQMLSPRHQEPAPRGGSELSAPLSGYRYVSLTWTGELEAGKGKATISGETFKDIEAQAQAMNPNYTIFDSEKRAKLATTSPPDRTDIARIWCDGPLDRVITDPGSILEGIGYLRGIKGDCHLGPGPSLCSRVSCSWNAAIYYCNNNRFDINVACAKLGDYAEVINENCIVRTTEWPTVKGQAFDIQNWNVFVARDEC